jgi:hypothetical protein
LQAAYEEFGCNDGNVFFMGIDKGNTNNNVHNFDSIYGIQYPSISGQEGGGNDIHLAYNIQATPTVAVILPDRFIAVKQIYPPNTINLTSNVTSWGGILQECMTTQDENYPEIEFSIIPNPATHYFYINLNLSNAGMIGIRIVNTMGTVIRQIDQQFYRQGNHFIKSDVTDLPKGLYFVHFYNRNTLKTEKVLIR